MPSLRRVLALVVALAAMVAGVVALDTAPASAAAVTFTVNSTADAADAVPGNGTCATSGGVCTLRAAFQEINAGSAANTYSVNFSVAGTTQLGSADLPELFRSVTIDGSTAPGYSVATGPTFTVRCESQDKDVSAYGLAFQATNSTLRALRLVNCSTTVITSSSATNLRVVGNQIGNDGSSFLAANAVDVAVAISGSGSVIGGPTAADRNVISGYRITGVLLNPSATNSSVQGNYIGTNAAGTAAIKNPNGQSSGQASAAIQTSPTGAVITGNLISGNPGWGVSAYEGSATLKGNLIGTDVTGAVGIGNGSSSVMVWPTGSATIGGTGAGEDNVLAYFVPSAGNVNAPLLRVFGGKATVLGNKIGSNAAGTASLCTTSGTVIAGVFVQPSDAGVGSQVTLGGTAAGAGNLIAGCSRNVEVRRSTGQTGGSTVTLQGNKIGTNAAGTAAMVALTGGSSNNAGILIDVDQVVTVGGTAAGAGNLISGNGTGIFVSDNDAGVKIQGNRIGTNAAGTAAVPNTQDGIEVGGAVSGTVEAGGGHIVIGGSAAGASNVISGNAKDGLLLARPGMVQGNLIGTNAAGTAALPNAGDGAVLNHAGITFGGTTAGSANVVSGNASTGILVVSTQVPTIQGNRIGTDVAGTAAIPNGRAGIFVGGATTAGSIGGVGAGEANLIARNGADGVYLVGADGVDIRGNLIHSNAGLNIDLVQHGESVSVSNHDQIHPTLSTATVGASTTSVAGTVSSDRAGTILVDVYAGASCNAGYGDGQAQQYLGAISVPYPVAGVATAFSGTVAKSTVGSVITATSTIAGNGTSQLSTCAPFTDIQITGKDTHVRAPIGTDVATELTVKNAGPTTASNVGIRVGVGMGPKFATDVATVDAPSVGTVDPTTMAWSIPTLAPGASATICVRGDIVRSGFTIEPVPGFPFTVATPWSPDATLGSGAVDPYIGNNRGYGSTTVGTPLEVGAAVCPLPTLSIDDAQLTRPASGTAPMSFTVRLSKAQTRPVTVRYQAVNGKAVAVEDYVATAGDLTFAAGETSKTVTVPIVGNQSDEPDKAFNVTLSAPKHALLGDGTAIGTVKANFALGGCPPGSTSVQRFVCHLYFDALGRTPDASGFNYWVGKLNRGTPRSTMAASYLVQPESLRKVANRAYVLYLGRNGTNAELSAWATKLKAKTATTQDIRISVLASAEYFTKTGGTNTLYIQQMFKDVFRRPVDSSGLAYWTGQLANGKTRTNVATRFMAEPEGRRKIVGDIYLRFLRRDPTTAQANDWVAKLAAGKTEVDVGIGLVASTEYFNRPQN